MKQRLQPIRDGSAMRRDRFGCGGGLRLRDPAEILARRM